MRKTYTIRDSRFVCRVPDVSDLWALHGKLPVLPESYRDDPAHASEEVADSPEKLLKFLAFADRLIVRCGIAPRFIAESPEDIPVGFQPIAEMDPFVRLELSNALMADASFGKGAAQAVRPSSATSEDSAS